MPSKMDLRGGNMSSRPYRRVLNPMCKRVREEGRAIGFIGDVNPDIVKKTVEKNMSTLLGGSLKQCWAYISIKANSKLNQIHSFYESSVSLCYAMCICSSDSTCNFNEINSSLMVVQLANVYTRVDEISRKLIENPEIIRLQKTE